MEFVNQLIDSSKFASFIALTAFLLSTLSFFWTRRSAKISKQVLDESIKNNNHHKKSEIEQKKYELLRTISEEWSLLERQLTLIGALQADYDASVDAVKVLMGDRIKLFTETLPMVTKYKKDIQHAHLSATNWNIENKNGVSELLKLQAEQDIAMLHTQSFVECNASLVTNFREKLLMTQLSYLDKKKD
jgi:hypothetical protein